MIQFKKVNTYIAFFLLMFAGVNSYSQQTPIYSQYMFNDFVINPAIASVYDYYQIRTTNRFQWIGIKDAPITNILSVYGPNKTGPWGLGATVYSDNTGPTGKTGAYLSYGYYVKIVKDIKLSFGLSLGLTQFKIDESKFIFENNEPTGLKKFTWINPDATSGLYLYNEDFYFGFSADQLFRNKMPINYKSGIARVDSLNRLKIHYTTVAGYKVKLSKEYEIEPSILFRATSNSSPQLELSSKFIYKKTLWLGASYRTSDAVAFLLGYTYKEKIYLGYAYDMTYSKLNVVSQGSHEIMVGARFNKIRTSRRGR